MSRIGQMPIEVPSGVEVKIDGAAVNMKGKRGELQAVLAPEVEANLDDGKLTVVVQDESKRTQQLWGMWRANLQNMVTGVSDGFVRNLEIQGVGYRAAVQGKTLKLDLGFSHQVIFPIPEGIEIKCEKPTAIAVAGADKQRVGQVAAEIRAYRKPEPYKGKGIRYEGEYVRRKEGKKK
ncbi:MAG: 50S ribosomal protein L6 [Rhodospirillaceae bacterium]|jgi:large subunit ribosomal protein L6|nr:50S ribosomal protein L6 [Rhodospirillaceae bacterium]